MLIGTHAIDLINIGAHVIVLINIGAHAIELINFGYHAIHLYSYSANIGKQAISTDSIKSAYYVQVRKTNNFQLLPAIFSYQ